MIHVVLIEPEIPHNTGNIMRTCAAAGVKLHLIEPLGFSLDEKYIKRCSTGYEGDSDYYRYPNYETFLKQHKENGTFYFLTRYGTKTPAEFDYRQTHELGDIYFVFGKESSGIPKEILKGHLETCIRIPMKAEVRSLNLSNCVAIMVYDALGQLGYPNLSNVEVQKGADFLTK